MNGVTINSLSTPGKYSRLFRPCEIIRPPSTRIYCILSLSLLLSRLCTYIRTRRCLTLLELVISRQKLFARCALITLRSCFDGFEKCPPVFIVQLNSRDGWNWKRGRGDKKKKKNRKGASFDSAFGICLKWLNDYAANRGERGDFSIGRGRQRELIGG